jgi:NAD(P)-binding Rossmann-like domain
VETTPGQPRIDPHIKETVRGWHGYARYTGSITLSSRAGTATAVLADLLFDCKHIRLDRRVVNSSVDCADSVALGPSHTKLAADIQSAGGRCELQVWPHQVHVFQALPRMTPEAGKAIAYVARFIAHALQDARAWSTRCPDDVRPAGQAAHYEDHQPRPQRSVGISNILPHRHIPGRPVCGLGAAIRLAEAGVTDITVLDRSDRMGGTWRDTTYPGASCDVPSLLYSYSFVKNPTWSRTYSTAPQICRHLDEMATKFGIRRHIRFNQAVASLTFDDDSGVWTGPPRTASGFAPAPSCWRRGRCRTSASPTSRPRHLPRTQDPQCPLGSRLRLHRQARPVVGTGVSAIQIIPELVKPVQAPSEKGRRPVQYAVPTSSATHPELRASLESQTYRPVPKALSPSSTRLAPKVPGA